MHRLFVAIRPPAAIRAILLGAMGGISGARWQSEDQLHLTLRFIGEVDRHRAGEDHGERIWNLMVLETWFRQMIDGRAAFVREIAVRAEAIARDRAAPMAKRSAAS